MRGVRFYCPHKQKMDERLLVILLLCCLSSMVCPSGDQCNHWNTTSIPIAAATPIDCITASIVDEGMYNI